MTLLTYRIAAVACASLMLSSGFCAQAQAWPTRPVRIIVPAPPGGGYDSTIRALAQDLALQLKQAVVVENKPGAGNIVGTQAGATALPDGYTLTMTGMLNTIAQGLYERVPFDIVRDFAHIATIGAGEQWLVAHSQAGISSFEDLITLAHRKPGRISYSTSGQGSTGHLVMELLQRATGTSLTHIPYKGGAPALQDVLANLVPVTVIPQSGALQHVQSGKLKVLAVSGTHRAKDLPLVPTFEELGYRQLTVTSWVALSAPKGTPSEIVSTISAAVRASLSKADVVAKLEAQGLTPFISTPDQTAQLFKSDTERWGQLTRTLNIKVH